MTKEQEAIELVKSCWGELGVWASNDRYKHQCWTRDFCMTIFPIMNNPKSPLFEKNLIASHLEQIIKYQAKSGKIPILFLDNEKEFLKSKINKAIKDGKMSFMLQRYLDDELYDLTPNTRDSEILFIIAAMEFVNTSQEDFNPIFLNRIRYACKNALNYLENYVIKDDYLIKGGDWRDARIDLDDKQILTNAVHLYRVYQLMEKPDKAESVKQILQTKFWNGTYFVDYIGINDFDILGNTLCIQFGIATKEQTESIFQYAYDNLRTPFGYKFADTFLPPLSVEEQQIMNKHKAVIWTFISGFMIKVMLQFGSEKWKTIATEDIKNWDKQTGFNEWYDIEFGKGYGSKNQVWSACLYLAVKDIKQINDNF